MTAPIIDRAWVEILPMFKGFNEKLKRDVQASVGSVGRDMEKVSEHVGATTEKMAKHTEGLFSSMKESARSLFTTLAPMAAGLGIIEFVKGAVTAAGDAARLTRQTVAVVKSTGAAAHVSALQVGEYADALSTQTGITKDVIQDNENLLLTFTNIQNRVGKGNDIFNQATKAVLDMSVALKEDGKSASIQLGKALNDPIKGITALSRVGVAFTEQQKEQIKTMVKSGNILGAQKVILGELNKEFGGSAVAQSSMGAKMKAAYHEVEVAVGAKLLPVMKMFSTFMVTTMLPAFMHTLDAAGKGEGAFGSLRTMAVLLWTAMKPLIGQVLAFAREAWNLATTVLNLVLPALVKFITWFTSSSTRTKELREAILLLAGAVLLYKTYMVAASIATSAAETIMKTYRTAVFLITVATRGWAAAQAGLDGALLANPIGLIVVAVAALAAGVYYAWNHFAGFRVFLINAWKDIKTATLDVWHGAIEPAFKGIAAVALWLWEKVIYPEFMGWKMIIEKVVVPVVLWLWHNVLEPAFKGISIAVRLAWDVLKPIFDLISWMLRNIVGPTVLWLWHNVVETGFHAIWIIIEIAWAIIKKSFEGWAFYMQHVLAPIILWLWHNILEPTWRGISMVIEAVWNNVLKPIFNGFAFIIEHVVAPAFQRGVDFIEKMWARIKDVARTPINFVIGFVNTGIIHPFNAIAGFFGVQDHLNDIGKLADGGMTHGLFRGKGGPREDKNLALVSDGEFWVNARSTRKWLPVLEYINSDGARGQGPQYRYPGDGSSGIRAFADGGLVGWLSSIGHGIMDFITNPVSAITDFTTRLLGAIPGGHMLQGVISGMGHKLVDGLIHWTKNAGGTGGAAVGGAVNFLRQQVGKRYGWAMAGPDAYDCSGIVSAIWNVLHGKMPYSHTFSTSNEAGFFPQRGFGGVLTAGWTNPGETGVGGGPNGVGHTGAVLSVPGLGLLPFESTGSQGVHMGANVTPLSAFAHMGHYARGGVVPGLMGVPQAAIVHGGEQVLPPGPLDLSDETIEKLARALGRQINRVGSQLVRTARAA